jgi:hypothetical protein
MVKSSTTSTWSNMGRRAFTNPSKIESERERARNRYRRQQQRQQQRRQNLVRQECSTCPVVRVVNSIHGQMPPQDASCSGLVHNGTTIALPAHQRVPSASTSAITMLEEARPSVCSIEHSPSYPTACDTTDIQVASSLTGQPAEMRRGAEQVAAHIVDAPPTRRPWPRHRSASPGTSTPQGCTPQSTRALTRLRVQRYRNRLHRLRIPPTLPSIVRTDESPPTSSPGGSGSGTMTDCRCRFVAGTPDHPASMRYARTHPQPCPVCSCGASSSQCSSGSIVPTVDGNCKETLDSFINALRYQDTELSSDFLGSHETAYDHAFRNFFNPKCNCTSRRISSEATERHILTEIPESGGHGSGVNEPEHTCSLQESVRYLQDSLPTLSTVFGEAGSYDPGDFFRQWKDFLANKPSRPLSFLKSQIDLFPANEPELVLSRQWDVDSVWLGATGL